MKTNKIKDKKVGLVPIFLTVFLMLFTNLSFAQKVVRFPYSMDFTKGKPDGVIYPSIGGGINQATFNSDGLSLTKNQSNNVGGIVLDSRFFDSTYGLVIEFEYSIYGEDPYNGYGEGLSFFIYDGNVSSPILGAGGGGLGYNYNVKDRMQGLSKAYLGIGFDVYGGFKSHEKGRWTGVQLPNPYFWCDSSKSFITLRGGYDPKNNNGKGVLFSGYPVLATQSTIATSKSVVGNAYSHGSIVYGGVDPTDGGWRIDKNYLSNNFDIRSGEKNPLPSSPNYRKAFITLVPVSKEVNGGGFYVTVRVQAGTKPLVTVIDKFHYKESLKYVDNHYDNNYISFFTLNATVPSTFKIGFAASTGSTSEAHLIKTLKINVPYNPVPSPDSTQFCDFYKKQSAVIISPFDNDSFFTGLVGTSTIPTPGNTNRVHIDYNTFRFEDSSGNLIGGVISSVANRTVSFRQPNVGLWVFSTLSGKVTFTPVESFVGDAVIYYSAKGPESNIMPYGQEAYRSAPTKITVKGIRCNAISNSQLPSNRPTTSGK